MHGWGAAFTSLALNSLLFLWKPQSWGCGGRPLPTYEAFKPRASQPSLVRLQLGRQPGEHFIPTLSLGLYPLPHPSAYLVGRKTPRPSLSLLSCPPHPPSRDTLLLLPQTLVLYSPLQPQQKQGRGGMVGKWKGETGKPGFKSGSVTFYHETYGQLHSSVGLSFPTYKMGLLTPILQCPCANQMR